MIRGLGLDSIDCLLFPRRPDLCEFLDHGYSCHVFAPVIVGAMRFADSRSELFQCAEKASGTDTDSLISQVSE